MKNLKIFMKILTLTLFCLVLSSPAALAANIVIDKETGPAGPGIFHTPNYANDATCIQAALDNSKSGDTITIREGDYYIKNRIYQSRKSLKIIGEGEVTLHIQTPEKEFYGIYFSGSLITSKNLAANAKKGSSQVVLTDASQVRQNDLIKIWKNVKWCPLDYPDQMTGEIYAVKSVNGNVVTLNEPLLRDYSLSETVQTEVYRPIEMHIKNIRLEDTGATTSHHGLVMQYCKDSSVTNSWFSNSGFGAICLYSCFNVDVNNNEIYDCLKPGSGYGVNVASGSAFVNIEQNHIENCRHAITGNSAELKSLNRDVFIAENTLLGAKIAGSDVVDAHPVTINYIVTRNIIYPQLPYFFAFLDGTQYSEFTENEVCGGYGAVVRRGSVNDGVHIIKDNIMDGIAGVTYQGGENGIGDTLIITNNVQNSGEYGVYFPYHESFRNIIISGNTFSNLLNRGVYQQFLINGVNLKISDNTFENIRKEGIYLDGNSYANGDVEIQNNNLINVYPSSPGSEIIIKNIQGAPVSGNQIFNTQVSKVPVAVFSASPTSGNASLDVTFTDSSIGTPTSWNWNFGDGTGSTEKSPKHTYSTAGTYTVKLTVTNAAGSNTATKSNFITVAGTTAQKSVINCWGSPRSGTAPLTVTFKDNSAGSPTAWNWSFGDGKSSTLQNPKHTYSAAGSYTVKLTVTNTAGSTSVTKYNYITVT
jgi:PKD repeat protein